jgi:D-galactarolactone cycloisomerase
VPIAPHGWNTTDGVAADLALSAAMPVARWVEVQTGVPYFEEILTTPFRIDADCPLPIPSGPGLGIELDWDAVKR